MSDSTPPEGPYQPPGAMPPPPPAPGPTIPAGVVLAAYSQRVAAYLIDGLIAVLLAAPGTTLIVVAAVAANDGSVNGVLLALGIVLVLAGVAVHIWNVGWRQGTIGQSWGKGIMNIMLVRVADGALPGGGIGLARYFVRQLLGSVTGVYTVATLLWPLWDERRQTLDDKIVSTLVIEAR